MTIKDISPERILKGALLVLNDTKYKVAPCWVGVVDLCGVGSTSARIICRELGINPELTIAEWVVKFRSEKETNPNPAVLGDLPTGHSG